jgi:histidyl-tRNA synthetase
MAFEWGEYLENLVGDKVIDLTKEVFSVNEDTLKQLVWRYPLTKIAADYGVSEAAVRKRCKKIWYRPTTPGVLA